MEEALRAIVAKLLEHGPWGVMIIWLAYNNWQLNQKIGEEQKVREAVQERRSQEREKNAEVMAAASAAQIRVADAIRVLANEISDGNENFNALREQFVRLQAEIQSRRRT